MNGIECVGSFLRSYGCRLSWTSKNGLGLGLKKRKVNFLCIQTFRTPRLSISSILRLLQCLKITKNVLFYLVISRVDQKALLMLLSNLFKCQNCYFQSCQERNETFSENIKHHRGLLLSLRLLPFAECFSFLFFCAI